MRFILFLLFFIIVRPLFTQEDIAVKLLDSISLNADVFIGADDFEDYYFIEGNTLFKKTAQQVYSYTNTQLGNIASVDITNPLKILVFYQDFNTIVLLDNRLNELSDRMNLSTISYQKNAAFASISSNNNLWLYSLDDNILTLWNYENKETVFESQPLQFYKSGFEAAAQTSSYENCWLASENDVLKFNEYGSFIAVSEIKGIKAIQSYNNGIIFMKKAEIYFHDGTIKTSLGPVDLKHLSTNFFVNKNTLYFFRSNRLYRYRILKN